MTEQRYKVVGESTETPEPEKPRTVKVTPPPPKQEKEIVLTAGQRIMQAITDTPDDRMPEMTYLTKQMAFYISLQVIQNPAFAINALDAEGHVIDLPSLWEKIFYKLSRSVGGVWAGNAHELAKIQMAGIDDDDMDLGESQ